MSGFFAELRRRKVYRVAAAYVVGGGFIIQIASAVFPAWELPPWSLRLLIVFVLAGFPLALIFAWAFDVTSSGLERTPALTGVRRRQRNVVLLAGFGLLVSIAAGVLLWPGPPARPLEKSIAVLPFQSMSSDPENTFFADGIQDDILTTLGKISDLKVISRTSVRSYRDKPASMREIGKALDVAAVLEGSVRRSGSRVRVNVQLINAATDHHIWSQEYDCDLYDVFDIQSDLAQRISHELKARLSPDEKARVNYRPTDNTEAYLAYIEGRNLHNNWENFPKLQLAEQLYERAVQLDPKFALAFAHFSQLESWIFIEHDRVPARREKARALAERALAVQPGLPEAHLATGFFHYYGSQDYNAALREFQIAQRGLPNSYEVYLALGAIHRRQGRWNDSTASFEKSTSLNPNDTWPLQNLSFNQQRLRNFPAALATLDRALRLQPKSIGLRGLKGWYTVAAGGDFSEFDHAFTLAKELPPGLEREKHLADVQSYALLLQRRFSELLRMSEDLSEDILSRELNSLYQKYFVMGVARMNLGDEPGAREAAGKARIFAEKIVAETPDDQAADAHAKLAEVLAFLGEKEAAIAHGLRASELLPESKDAFYGPVIAEALARVYAGVAEPDRAIDLLEGLLARPTPLTTALLKVQPAWDPLRGHPRFQALLEEYARR